MDENENPSQKDISPDEESTGGFKINVTNNSQPAEPDETEAVEEPVADPEVAEEEVVEEETEPVVEETADEPAEEPVIESAEEVPEEEPVAVVAPAAQKS